jgi:hypothetical protein
MKLIAYRGWRKILWALVALFAANLLLLPAPDASAQATESQVAAFRKYWARTDDLVYEGIVKRSWIWGPKALEYTYRDSYRFDKDDKATARAFRHYDKGRMEIDPREPAGSKWYIRGGTLVKEMVMGRVQSSEMGDTSVLNRWRITTPAEVPVVGDLTPDANTPTYATFSEFASLNGDNRRPNAVGEFVTKVLPRDGVVRENIKTSDPKAKMVFYENVTGHNIPAAFWDYFNTEGTVLNAAGERVREKLFDRLAIFGYPITEPYWARVKVGGKTTLVLLQLFERRVLTYTPSNSAEFQVEMGNAGLHYLQWRKFHDLSFTGPPRITVEKFKSVLRAYKSPVTDEAEDFYDLINSYGLDPGIALAFFIRESSAGTGVGYCDGKNSLENKNWGNVRGDEGGACRFQKFNTWREGLDFWCRAMYKYFINRGLDRMDAAIPVYAPRSDGNDPDEYIATMQLLMLRWQGYNPR